VEEVLKSKEPVAGPTATGSWKAGNIPTNKTLHQYFNR